jgi:ligand-binding sensor domain-containing protein
MAALSFVAPLAALVHAQTPEWTDYTTRNTGMPDNIVRALAVDASGAVWVGTPEGIGRYDGVEWTVLNAENSPLPTSDVWSLTFDAEGGHPGNAQHQQADRQDDQGAQQQALLHGSRSSAVALM